MYWLFKVMRGGTNKFVLARGDSAPRDISYYRSIWVTIIRFKLLWLCYG